MDLHPLSELPHPIVAKAAQSFGSDPSEDNFVGTIASSTDVRLLEIKHSQWRGGVWEDAATGVCWLAVAGLAKGDHRDREDFYRRIARESESGDPTRWLPGEDDVRLLKQETAARLRTEWELRSQMLVFEALQDVHSGGTRRIEIPHPVPHLGRFAQVEITVTIVRGGGYNADEVMIEIIPEEQYAGSALLWQLTVRALISVEPPEQSWDRFGNTYTDIGEPGAWTARLNRLGSLVGAGELATSVPGPAGHYTHRVHLAGQTINGEAVRALCGVHFVPTQDHDALLTCQVCEERLAELPS